MPQTSAVATLPQAREKIESLRRSMSAIRKRGAEVGERFMVTSLTIAGGAGAGYIAKKWPGQLLKVDKEVWVGGALLVLGLTGLGGNKMSDAALALGGGVIAGYLYNRVRNAE